MEGHTTPAEHPALIAVDWGTTNRRAFLLDAAGQALERREEHCGVTAIEPGGFEAEANRLRDWGAGAPMLLAGMIGSDRGWRQVDYLPCPVGLEELAAHLVPVDGGAFVVPGVADLARPMGDVMRGEEVQLLGAVAAGLCPTDGAVCHPGTHSKWVRIDRGRIAGFRSIMTGELFALLSGHGILAHHMGGGSDPESAAFRDGVAAALEESALTSDLFEVRAGVLLGRLAAKDAASRVSGLLIGADIATGLAFVDGARGTEVVLIGDPFLTRSYAVALGVAGVPTRQVDGEGAFVAGAHTLMQQQELS